jgi:hypothetical protein
MSAAVTLFRRRCRVVVGTIEVVPLESDPSKALTVGFKVDKSLDQTPNKAELRIFNLHPTHRAQVAEQSTVPVQIDAGYEEGASTIFLGRLSSSKSIPDGAGNWITTLSSADGAVEAKTNRVSVSVAKGAATDVVLRAVVSALGVAEGNVSDAIAKIKANALGQLFASGTVLHGRAAVEMTRICRSVGLRWSVQDGKLQFLSLRQALAGKAVLLSSSTGLVETPTVDPKGVLKARMLMAPDVFPGRLLVLQSKVHGGQWRIEKTSHTGDTKAADWFIDIEAKRN